MVIVSHDREFLDQLCTKVVETEHGLATTYKCGNQSLDLEGDGGSATAIRHRDMPGRA